MVGGGLNEVCVEGLDKNLKREVWTIGLYKGGALKEHLQSLNKL